MTKADSKVLKEVLYEVRSLKERMSIMIPSESIDDYTHPSRILVSYNAAKRELAGMRRNRNK